MESLSSLYVLPYCIRCYNCARILYQACEDLPSSKHECYRLELRMFEAVCSTTGGLGSWLERCLRRHPIQTVCVTPNLPFNRYWAVFHWVYSSGSMKLTTCIQLVQVVMCAV